MIAILTSELGDNYIVNGKRVPKLLSNDNGLTDRIKGFWKEDSNVLIICSNPDEFEINDSILHCQREAFNMSGLKANSFEVCDYRNEEIVEKIDIYDVVLLSGGHVPTQNKFFQRIHLKEKLDNFEGLVIALSAGSMNSAETVYALPELDGEGIDPEYRRFIPGLGLTQCMIIPHFQYIRTCIIDELRIIDDMAYPDSVGKEFIALNDGSYIISDKQVDRLYGEAFLIKDGKQIQICGKNEWIQL